MSWLEQDVPVTMASRPVVTYLDTLGSAVRNILLHLVAPAEEVGGVPINVVCVSPAVSSEVGARIIGCEIVLRGLVDERQSDILDSRIAVGPQVLIAPLPLIKVSIHSGFRDDS